MNREEFSLKVKGELGALRSFLLALCGGNRQDADDLAQDSLVKAYLSISSSYNEQGSFRAWLFRIAHNTFLNHKVYARAYDSLDEALYMVSTNSADHVYAYETLYLALSTLPPKERSAIVLFYLNGYSVKEIAQIIGLSEDAVKKQLSRGREKLKMKMKL